MGVHCNKCKKHIYYYASKPTKNTNSQFQRCNKCQAAYYCVKCKPELGKHYKNCKGDKEPRITILLLDEIDPSVPKIDYILMPEELGGNVENVCKSFKMEFGGMMSNCYEIKEGNMCVVMNKKGNYFLQNKN